MFIFLHLDNPWKTKTIQYFELGSINLAINSELKTKLYNVQIPVYVLSQIKLSKSKLYIKNNIKDIFCNIYFVLSISCNFIRCNFYLWNYVFNQTFTNLHWIV